MKTIITSALLSLSAVSAVAQSEAPPNILFIIADDASMNTFGAYGGTMIKTPAFDRLAEGGARFQQAYNCNPKCAPARACLVTGRYSWQLGAAANHWPAFPPEFTFYPHLLMEHGFHVGYTGKGWGPGSYSTEHNPAGPVYNSIKEKPRYKGINPVNYAANFEVFLDEKPTETPFCFWLGTYEPHRFYEKDSWKREGMKLEQAEVPPFYPDNETIRGDLLDYALEVKHFDKHIGLAIRALEERGLLENTLILVTSDHGMPFPRIKGQIYEEGFHVPLIAYWKGVVKPGRIIDDFVSFPDVAPTIMEAVGMPPHKQMTGKSFLDLLKSEKSGQIDPSRNFVLLGKERHDTGRADGKGGTDLAYPVRAIRTKDFLYVHNIKPDLWPAGNPEYGFRNVDNSPTKSYLTALQPDDPEYTFYEMSFGKRPEEELYQIRKDPNCMNNLAGNPEYDAVRKELRERMEKKLTAQGDPRTLGQGDIFDAFPYDGKQFDYQTGKPVQNRKKK